MKIAAPLQFTTDAVYAGFHYRGTPDKGMLALLDGDELMQWWKPTNAVVEPFPGGLFYLAWQDLHPGKKQALYGVVQAVDTDAHQLALSKMMYVFPEGKIGPLHVEMRFDTQAGEYTCFQLIQRHRLKGSSLKFYRCLFSRAWPRLGGRLQAHLEA